MKDADQNDADQNKGAPGARDLERAAHTLAQHPDFRVLCRVALDSEYRTGTQTTSRPADATRFRGVILDLETTGFELGVDRLMEIGAIAFDFTSDGEIVSVGATYSELEDPGVTIPEVVTKITGLDAEAVKGHAFDDDAFHTFMAGTDLIAAHNAGFDRPMLETRFPQMRDRVWGCTYRDIDWREKGFENQRLDYLLFKHGYFYDGHRAVNDCEATLHLLGQNAGAGAKSDGRPGLYLADLLAAVRRKTAHVWAVDAPFDNKDLLRNAGYQWCPSPKSGEHKAWHREIDVADLEAEMRWLGQDVYMRPQLRLPVDFITAKARYTKPDLTTHLQHGHAQWSETHGLVSSEPPSTVSRADPPRATAHGVADEASVMPATPQQRASGDLFSDARPSDTGPSDAETKATDAHRNTSAPGTGMPSPFA